MRNSITLERGRRAGNILLAQTLVSAALSVLMVLTVGDSIDLGSALIGASIAALFNIAINFILISPLKKDKLNSIRAIYIILCCLSVAFLYFNYVEGASDEGVFSLLGVSVNVIVVIALYLLGPVGKVCCFIAAGLSLVSAVLPIINSDFYFPDIIDALFSVVYYVFLGAYVESKKPGAEEEEEADAEEEETEVSNDEQPNKSGKDYDDLIKLKELMDKGVITPAEYQAKKKQILGL